MLADGGGGGSSKKSTAVAPVGSTSSKSTSHTASGSHTTSSSPAKPTPQQNQNIHAAVNNAVAAGQPPPHQPGVNPKAFTDPFAPITSAANNLFPSPFGGGSSNSSKDHVHVSDEAHGHEDPQHNGQSQLAATMAANFTPVPGDNKVQAAWNKDANQIGQIDQMSNPDARNRQITKEYSSLSKRMNGLLGKDSGNNWTTWASYASSTAGQVIRQQAGSFMGIHASDIPGWVGTASHVVNDLSFGLLGDASQKITGKNLFEGKDQAEAASKGVGQGNQKVFEEIAPQFARFIDTFQGDKKPDAAKLAQFDKGLGPEQGDLKKAFGDYYQAMFAKDPGQKQEFTLAGNLEVANREQQRLQPNIQGAVHTVGVGEAMSVLSQKLPGQKNALGLSKDVPEQMCLSPQAYKNNPTLRNELQQFAGPNWYSTKGSGAHDWSNFNQRMHYITELMLQYQNDPALMNGTPT
jgi:hypothetical protein